MCGEARLGGAVRLQPVETEDRVGVADVKGEKHAVEKDTNSGEIAGNQRLASRRPPVVMVTRPCVVRTSRKPFVSRPAVMPSQACGP